MSKVVFNSPVDLSTFDFASLLGGTASAETSHGLHVTAGAYAADVVGHHLQYDDNGALTGGEIRGFSLFDAPSVSSQSLLDVSRMHISVEQLLADAGNPLALLNDLLGGHDHIFGSTGADNLFGLGGDDHMVGGMGADTLHGGGGADFLGGGADANTFVFDSIGDSTTAAPDLIKGLHHGVIDISGIDADTTVDGDQAFARVDAFDGHAGQLTVSYDSVSNLTSISGDEDGDGVADFTIHVENHHLQFDGYVL